MCAVVEDHVDAKLLFAGTEFGLYFTKDGGSTWIQLKGGLPTIAVRDIAVQQRENDLVLATFGRGFYILDDYTPLRTADEKTLTKAAHLFRAQGRPRLHRDRRLGLSLSKAFQGDGFYTAPNPPLGAVFTYHLAEGLKTRQEQRIEAEEKAAEDETTLPYPDLESLRAEDDELEPTVVLTVRDSERGGRPPRQRAAGEGAAPRLLGPAPAFDHPGRPDRRRSLRPGDRRRAARSPCQGPTR